MRRPARFLSPDVPDRDVPIGAAGAARFADTRAVDLPELPPVARHFHRRLLHVPLGVWAERAARDANGEHVPLPDPDTSARKRLRRLMDEHPAVVAQVRRRIADTVAAADGFVESRVIPRMERVALTAALALVARDALGDEEFQRLYRPFADLIPERELLA